MIPPAKQRIIQIDITNACPHRCSNCTRFTSHVKKPFFMDWDTFKRAVDSLVEFPGMVGIMGGEPTLHPEFDRFVRYYADKIGPPARSLLGRKPIEDFAAHREANLANVNRKRGLWTSLGPGYKRHFELIQEVFGYQCINDHRNPALHQALLISRGSLGIGDADWIALRDKCWLQRMWSASVTPKGAFFCEVAAALDMLFDGPGGWPIEPGWWKRTPDQFGEQLQWCERCSAPLQVPRRLAVDEVDDVSPDNLERLRQIDAPSSKKAGRLCVFDTAGYDPAKFKCRPDSDWYMPEEFKAKRIAATNDSLKIRRLDGLCVCVWRADWLRYTLPGNVKQFDRFVVVTTSDDWHTHTVAHEAGATLVVSDECYRDGVAFNKGAMLNAGLKALSADRPDWVLFTDADVFLHPEMRAALSGFVLNPGCLYYTRRFHVKRASDYRPGASLTLTDPSTNQYPWGYFQLWNPLASAIKDRPHVSERFCSAALVDSNWHQRWPKDKRVLLPSCGGKLDVVHLEHGPLGSRWNGSRACTGWRIIGQFVGGNYLPVGDQPTSGFIRAMRADNEESVILACKKPEHDCRAVLKPDALHVGVEVAWCEHVPEETQA